VHGVLSEGDAGMREGPWAMGDDEHSGLRSRGEEALGELAQAVLENPLLSQAVGKALDAGERAAQAQRSAIGALNLASAADLERLERRLRSLSDRLEAVEDQLDELAAHGPAGSGA
jgi:chromosome segregation ATPase